MDQLRALWGKRIGGVPVPVIFVVLLVAVWLVIRRRHAQAAATDVQPDVATVDESTPVGAMQGSGGGAGSGYDFPQPYGGGGAGPDGPWWQGAPIWNDNAGDTTAAGGPTGSAAAPAKQTPPKEKSHHSSHPAGHHEPPHKGAHPHAAKAPAKKTTAHRARLTNPNRPTPTAHNRAAMKSAKAKPRRSQPIRRSR